MSFFLNLTTASDRSAGTQIGEIKKKIYRSIFFKSKKIRKKK